MATPELLRSWKRTETYLRDARAHLSQIAEAEFKDEVLQTEEYIEQNELGLAFETLDCIAEESQWESQRVFVLLALAAASMGLRESQQRLDATVSRLRGCPYQTILPPAL